MAGSEFAFSGEMGIVSRGTGELGFNVVGAVSTVAMVKKGKVMRVEEVVGGWKERVSDRAFNERQHLMMV